MMAWSLQSVLTVRGVTAPATLEAQGWDPRSSGGTPSHSEYGHGWAHWECRHQPPPRPRPAVLFPVTRDALLSWSLLALSGLKGLAGASRVLPGGTDRL